MTHSILLLLHICSAIVGLLSGFLAVALRKGSGMHAAAGTLFFFSMLSMSSSAAWMAAFMKPNMLNLIVSLLTFYLVCTGWWAAKRREAATSFFDWAALVLVLAVGSAGIRYGLEAKQHHALKDGMPAAAYFIFGSIALLLGASDGVMLKRGGVAGARRLARHVWRMCLALLIATASFFPGQARQLPPWLRNSTYLYIPHVLLAGTMLFWLYRVRVRKRLRPDQVIAPKHDVAIGSGVRVGG